MKTMTKARYIERHGEAAYRAHVCPLLYISMTMVGDKWQWSLNDHNGTANGRPWRIDGEIGYDDIQEAAIDAELSYRNHCTLFAQMDWRRPGWTN